MHFCLSALVLVALAACSENTLYIEGNSNSGGDESITEDFEINGNFTIDGKYFPNVTSVHNAKYTGNITESNFSLKAIDDIHPELIFGTNDKGNITFLYKGVVVRNKKIEINEISTATAMLSLHPALWSLDNSEYGDFETQIKKLKSFDNLVLEVKKNIEAGTSVFDPYNESLMTALAACYKELINIYVPSTAQNKSLNIASDILAKKADTNNQTDTYPIEFSPESNKVGVRSLGWAPAYECTVIHKDKRTVDFILPHSTYALGDLFRMAWTAGNKENVSDDLLERLKYSWNEFSHGDWTYFDISDAGDYDFILQRDSENAAKKMYEYQLSDLLNTLMGSQVDMMDISKKEKLIGQLFVDVCSYAADPTNRTSKESFIDGLDKLVTSCCQTLVQEAMEGKFATENVSKVIKGLTLYYGLIVYGVNLFGRDIFLLAVPNEVTQCFSQHHLVVTDCQGVGVYVKEGNNQYGERGKSLIQPIKLGIKCHIGQGVRYEVIKGGGTLDHYNKTIISSEGEEAEDVIRWTLGSMEGEQIIKAWIEDVDTHEKEGLSCVISAKTDSKGTLLTSIGDAYRFTYDEKGRMTSVTDRTCMLVEPDPSEIVTSRFEYKNSDGKELSRIVSTGDGETDRWYDIQYNSDGNIKSFKWSGTDEYGTEYGAGQFLYEPDGRIRRIISYNDDGNTYLDFTWKGGLLTNVSYSDPTADDPDDRHDGYSISYGDTKNLHEQYTMGMIFLDLGTLFFSGQVGLGTTYLPSNITSSDGGINLKYSLRNDGYIMRESMRLANNPTMGYDFNYSYKEAPSSARSVGASSPVLRMPANGMKLHKRQRMFRLKR